MPGTRASAGSACGVDRSGRMLATMGDSRRLLTVAIELVAGGAMALEPGVVAPLSRERRTPTDC